MKKYYFVIPKNLDSFKKFLDVFLNPFFVLSGKSMLSDDYTIMTTTSKIVYSKRMEIVYSKYVWKDWFIIPLV